MSNSRETKLVLALTVALAVGSVSAAYEIKDLFPKANELWIKLAGVVIGVIFGPQLGIAIVKRTYQRKSIRKFLSGGSWVEGVWLIRTYADNRTCAGVSQVYRDESGELMVRIFFPTSIFYPTGPAFSISDNVLLRERDLFYTNYFVSSGPGGKHLGIASGYFLKDLNQRHATRYEGNVFYEGKGMNVRQIGSKLPDAEVEKLIREFGHDSWMNKAIELHCQDLESDKSYAA
jgi:hypothetical protein